MFFRLSSSLNRHNAFTAITILAAMFVLLCWPMLFQGGPLLFFDSAGYLSQGNKIIATLLGAPDEVSTSMGTSETANAVKFLRSTIYAFSFAMISGLFGPITALFLQSLAIMLALWIVSCQLLEKVPHWNSALLGMFVLSALSPLPFVTSFAMPDLWGAICPIYAISICSDWRRISKKQVTFLIVVCSFGLLAHYGNLLSALCIIPLSMLIAYIRFKPSFGYMAVAAFPLFLALSVNMAQSLMLPQQSTHELSVAPKRLPVVLARSYADGPARWYLEDQCRLDPSKYTSCQLVKFGPRSSGELLFSSDGGIVNLDARDIAAIRAEEPIVVARAAMRYPFVQFRQTVNNTIRQFFLVGLGDIAVSTLPPSETKALKVAFDRDRFRTSFNRLSIVYFLAYSLSILVLLLFCALALLPKHSRGGKLAQKHQRIIAATFILLVFLVANAAIFGALSAPADRYQNRVAWLALWLLMLAVFSWKNASRADRNDTSAIS